MRGNRSKLWLADHVIFVSYRWLSWMLTALVLLYQGRLFSYATVLAVTAVVNLGYTAAARQFTSKAQRNPLVLGSDILYTLGIVAASGGWASPFVLYAYSSLVLPGLLD